jgi:hypothetical protein
MNGRAATRRARDIDGVLHAERIEGRRKLLHDLPAPTAELPNGAMILQDDAPHLILEGLAHPWSLAGYGAPMAPQDHARLITPPSTVAVLKAGYRPKIHDSAFTERDPRHAV